MEYKCRNKTALAAGIASGWLTINALKPISAAEKYAKLLNDTGHNCDTVEIEGLGLFHIIIAKHCKICDIEMDTANKFAENCGGDCLRCMGKAGDPDAMLKVAQLEIEIMEQALVRVAQWRNFPRTGKFYHGTETEMTYSALHGVNAERDFMKDVAASALRRSCGEEK